MECAIDDCQRKVRGHGFCAMHYARWHRYGDPNKIARVQRYDVADRCAVDGCDTAPVSRGLCGKHYDRFRAHGDPSTVLVDVRPAEARWKDSYQVVDVGYVTPCWLWTGKIGASGYGRIRNRRNRNGVTDPLAHRFVYEQVVGPIPDGLTLDHLCHNADTACNLGVCCPHRRCVNPDHLMPVTARQNVFSGRSMAAINAAKTHCKHGHEFTAANTQVTKDGKRYCRECGARRQRQLRTKRRRASMYDVKTDHQVVTFGDDRMALFDSRSGEQIIVADRCADGWVVDGETSAKDRRAAIDAMVGAALTKCGGTGYSTLVPHGLVDLP